MLCNNCGKENGENARFCCNCGSPLTTGEPVKKKSATGLVIAIVLVVALLVLGLAAGASLLLYRHITAMKDVAVEEETDDFEEEEIQTESDTVEETEPQADAEQLFNDYVTDNLEEDYGRIDISGEYVADYRNGNAGDYNNPYPVQYLEPMSGVITTKIWDFDNDDEKELLAVVLNDNEIDYQMYELVGEEIVCSDTRRANEGLLGCYDKTNWNLYCAESYGTVYLIENAESAAFVIADGASYEIEIMHYDGSCFSEDVNNNFVGSEFSDLEDEIEQTSSQIAELGFSVTASNLDYTLKFDKQAEEAETILKVTGNNLKASIPGTDVYSYYDSDDYSHLGTVTYQFYVGDTESEDTAITDYEPRKDDYSKSTKSGKMINAYIEYPVFEGNNKQVVDWLNGTMKIWADEYKENLFSDEELEELENNSYGDEEWNCQPTDIYSVYYDDDTASVALCWDWYMGGVNNGGWKAVNFDLKNMRYLYLPDVLHEDADTVKDKILEQLYQEYGINPEDVGDSLDNIYDCTFSFDEDTVSVYFESYELNLGGSYFEITLPRN